MFSHGADTTFWIVALYRTYKKTPSNPLTFRRDKSGNSTWIVVTAPSGSGAYPLQFSTYKSCQNACPLSRIGPELCRPTDTILLPMAYFECFHTILMLKAPFECSHTILLSIIPFECSLSQNQPARIGKAAADCHRVTLKFQLEMGICVRAFIESDSMFRRNWTAVFTHVASARVMTSVTPTPNMKMTLTHAYPFLVRMAHSTTVLRRIKKDPTC